ncbi:MAG: flagellar basal body P-ring formation chaperone FlgA [Planctomycetota bacterium]
MRNAIHAILGLLVLSSVGLAQAEAIRLYSTVVVRPGQELRLGDVADLGGTTAASLSGIVIDVSTLPADAAGWRRIDAQRVRDLLDAAQDAHRGRLELRGGPCYIRVASPAPANERKDHAAVPTGPASPGTVRHAAERWIARTAGVARGDVRIEWLADAEGLLDRTLDGLLPYITDSGRSGRVGLRIRLYDADAVVVAEGEVRAEVRVRRDVAVLVRDVARRRTLAAEDVRVEPRWLSPTERVAEPGGVVGREASGNLRAGSVVAAGDVQTAVVIERGDRVQVRVLTPTVTAMVFARALADGRPGETIGFETLAPARRDRIRFRARVESEGRAVSVTMGGAS